ncbi:MAG: Fe-S cluster assembly protein SufD [Pseudomonadota bacterium]
MNVIDRYREQFAQIEPHLPGANLTWVRRARHLALERFCEVGFPTTREEDWRYTNVTAIEKNSFALLPDSHNGINATEIEQLAITDSHTLVFVNGRFMPGLSNIDHLPQEIRMMNLATAVDRHSDAVEPLLTEDVEQLHNGFAALNAALWTDGAYIDFAGTGIVGKPIHLIFVATEATLALHPCNIVRLGKGCGATIIEHYVGLEGINYFTNAATRITLSDGAIVEHTKLQQEASRAFHIADTHTLQAQNSHFISHSFAFGSALFRNQLETRLDGEHCEATLNGLYVANGRQHMDNHTCIEHAQPLGHSREFYKGVLDGAARAVFNGKIIVHPDAQKTDARQSNRNLLLSDNAEVDTRPQLEIYADDVKCTHGATVGQLDENQIFYLRSRGVDEHAARTLLTCAFADEIVSRVNVVSLRKRLEKLLTARLRGTAPVGEFS